MRAARLPPLYAAAAVLLLLAAAPASAQQHDSAVAARRAPTLTPADYARWETLAATELSQDGRWLAYVVTRGDETEELRLRAVHGDSTIAVPSASRPAFSSDGRWLAYSIGVAPAERASRERAGQTVHAQLGLRELRTGSVTVVDDVAMFDFSADGRFVAMRGYAPPGAGGAGVDVTVRDLGTGTDVNFGNVAEHRWSDVGALLALVIDAAQRVGNGVRVYDARTATLRTLESDTAAYTGLVWRDDADDLAVLRKRHDDRYEETDHSVLLWRGVAARTTAHRFDPSGRAGFPAQHRIVDSRDLGWSRDGGTLFFGIRPATPKPDEPDSAAVAPGERPAVEIWHSADVDIIPEQKVRAGLERSSSQLVAWHLRADRFARLADAQVDEVTLSDGRFALGTDGSPYDRDRMFGPAYRDLYAIDIDTGERHRFAERVLYHYGPSPDGRFMLYVRDGHYWTYDTRTRRHTNITARLSTSFINQEHDYTVAEKPPYGTGGWSRDGSTVLLNDRYDVWAVRADGSGAVNLTHGAADEVRHRRVWVTPDQRFVDLDGTVYFTLYGERTKNSGYARLRRGRPAERLVYLDRSVTRLGKAARADVYYYRVEGADDSPDWFVGGPGLADARQVSHTNVFQREYAWTRGQLLDYRNASGQELQAALLYPADYEPGRRYPLIVYFYEITSNTLHNYSVPTERDAYNPAVLTQNGYFVLRPDIVYRGRDPGVSAVEALLPAVDAAVATGMIDPARVGLLGHSWGAYQTAFTITQTDRFAAAVAGAPLTNLISMYLSIYWNTGGTDARIFEIQQGRMEVPFWDDLDAYMRNSPLFSIRDMNTPLLVAFGDRDGAVDWHQGIELYNAARRAGKNMVMLVYEGENHSLSRKPNQIDLQRRVMQWFGHFLKGEQAPDWITRGVPWRDLQRELDRSRGGG